jgi:pantoate--beta-alanine ligase
MRIVRSAAAMQRLARGWQHRGRRVGLVPTMGYLHDGHLSLVRAARRRIGKSGRVVVSIYVNPTQFGPQEDFSRYPRDLARDLKLCRIAGADVVFAPSDAQMYPQAARSARGDDQPTQRAVPATGFSTYLVEERLSQLMEGAARPTHFRGVTTVVAKLFNLVLPELVVFGAKDWQQAAIVKRLVRDLNFPLKVVVAPTVRAPDGLALSSRNQYLTATQRAQAVILYRTLQRARAAVRRKSIPAARLKADLEDFIASAPLARLDYLEVFKSDTLAPVITAKRGTQLALAVFFGPTRLIDNGRL